MLLLHMVSLMSEAITAITFQNFMFNFTKSGEMFVSPLFSFVQHIPLMTVSLLKALASHSERLN